MVVCVVSAFYKIPSKNSLEEYLAWIDPFFKSMPFNLILFTHAELVPVFKTMREKWMDRTLIAELPLTEFNAFKKWGRSAWEKAQTQDTEIATGTNHSPELYATWYEKKEFVLRAIKMGAFGASHFVWCDAGILRFPNWLPYLHAFPREDLIPPGKMTLLQIDEFQPGDTVDTVLQGVNRIGGGIQAADAETWQWWCVQYDSMMIQYQLSNRFIGKDQSLMASLCLAHPDRVNLVLAERRLNGVQQWFWLLLYLAGVNIG